MHKGDGKLDGHGVRRIARNSAFVFTARVFDVTVLIVTIALIARYLGVTDFGLFAFVSAITVFLGPISDFGFERITTREIAGNSELADKYLGTAIICRIVLTVAIVLLILVATWMLGWDAKVVHAIYISTATHLLISMGMIGIGTIRAYEKMEYELAVKSVFNLVYFILVIFVINYDLGFLAVFGARLVSSFLQSAVLLIVTFSRFLKPNFSFDTARIRYMFSEAVPLGIFTLLLTASFNVDIFVLKYYWGPDDVALFSAAHRIILQLQTVPMAIVMALFPHFVRMARGSSDALRLAYSRTFKLMFILSMPLPAILTIVSLPVITLLFGSEFAVASVSLKILSWTIPLLFLIYLQSFLMTSEGRQVFNTISAGVCLLINFLLDLLLVPEYRFIGASVATLISYLVFFLTSLYFVSRTLGIPPLLEILPKPLIAAAAVGAGFVLVKRNVGGIAEIAMVASLFLVIYFLVLYFVRTLNPDELSVIRTIFSRRKNR